MFDDKWHPTRALHARTLIALQYNNKNPHGTFVFISRFFFFFFHLCVITRVKNICHILILFYSLHTIWLETNYICYQQMWWHFAYK